MSRCPSLDKGPGQLFHVSDFACAIVTKMHQRFPSAILEKEGIINLINQWINIKSISTTTFSEITRLLIKKYNSSISLKYNQRQWLLEWLAYHCNLKIDNAIAHPPSRSTVIASESHRHQGLEEAVRTVKDSRQTQSKIGRPPPPVPHVRRQNRGEPEGTATHQAPGEDTWIFFDDQGVCKLCGDFTTLQDALQHCEESLPPSHWAVYDCHWTIEDYYREARISEENLKD